MEKLKGDEQAGALLILMNSIIEEREETGQSRAGGSLPFKAFCVGAIVNTPYCTILYIYIYLVGGYG